MRSTRIGLKKQQEITRAIGISLLKTAIADRDFKRTTDIAIKLKMTPTELMEFIDKQ